MRTDPETTATTSPPSTPPARKKHWRHYLDSANRTAMHSLLRGSAGAAGHHAFTWILWWIQNH